MIVLFCSNNDNYFNKLIEWLTHYGVGFMKVDLSDLRFNKLNIDVNNENFILNFKKGESFEYNQISYFFYRSGTIITSNKKHTLAFKYLNIENVTIIDYIYDKIKEKSIGWIDSFPLNKLTQLTIARKNSLNIPHSKIINNLESYKEKFLSKNVLTKGIQENVGYQDTNCIYIQRVMTISEKDLPKSFYPSLFQEIIDKLFEIRTFYLEGDFYSIAYINNTDGLSVDMRENYDNHIYFRYNLPKEIENKLENFMNEIGLKSGSIDLIYSKDEKFYFLEVNPEGQYGWVSDYGGYNLDKKIAQFLKQKDDEFKKQKIQKL